MKILNLNDFKKEQKDFDTSRLSEFELQRLDYYIEVQRLDLLDKLSWLQTTEMHRLINCVSVKSKEELLADLQKKVEKLNEAVKEAGMQDLKVSMEERTEMAEGKPYKVFTIGKAKDRKHKQRR